MVVLAKYVIIR